MKSLVEDRPQRCARPSSPLAALPLLARAPARRLPEPAPAQSPAAT